MTVFAYRGVDRKGIGRAGRTTELPELLVPRLYRAGWRRLTVIAVGQEDVELGRIGRQPDTGRRVWSAGPPVPAPAV